jgi:rod shape-determining protein MreC
VLALLIVGSFVLLTITYGQSSGSLQRGVSTIFSPVQGVADRALKPARDLVDWFDKTFDARGENSRLKAELIKAREQAVAGQAAIQENAQLRKLVHLDQSPVLAESEYEPVTGSVIGRSPTLWQSIVNIDLGSGDGVRVDDPVLGEGALVGKISSVEPGSSQVVLITDNSSAVGAKVVPDGAQGEVRADIGDPESLILDFIKSSQLIHKGETVVTSGFRTGEISSLFPPDIPIGEVTRAPLVEREASQQVRLRPFADLANLEKVQVLTGGSRGARP